MSEYSVQTTEYDSDGTVYNTEHVEADSFYFQSVNDHRTFLIFKDENGKDVDVFTADSVYRIKKKR